MAAGTERLEGVLRDKAALNVKWDEQNHALVEGHERVVHEVTVEFEAKLTVRAHALRPVASLSEDLITLSIVKPLQKTNLPEQVAFVRKGSLKMPMEMLMY